MTPNLLDELEPRAWLLRIGDSDVWSYCEEEWMADFHGRKPGLKYEKQPLYDAPTLADMAKRMEAAERKLSRLTGMRNEWERDAREHLMTFGQHLPASVECLVERFDAAIDATQEGEG